jgi:hypothetical protein
LLAQECHRSLENYKAFVLKYFEPFRTIGIQHLALGSQEIDKPPIQTLVSGNPMKYLVPLIEGLQTLIFLEEPESITGIEIFLLRNTDRNTFEYGLPSQNDPRRLVPWQISYGGLQSPALYQNHLVEPSLRLSGEPEAFDREIEASKQGELPLDMRFEFWVWKFCKDMDIREPGDITPFADADIKLL